jgi:hypothetical protein
MQLTDAEQSCPNHPETLIGQKRVGPRLVYYCDQGCNHGQIVAKLAHVNGTNGHQKAMAPTVAALAGVAEDTPLPAPAEPPIRRESFLETVLKPQVALFDKVDEWSLVIAHEVQSLIVKGERDRDQIWFSVSQRLDLPSLKPPQELTATEQEEQIFAIIDRSLQPIHAPDEAESAIIEEDYEGAIAANAEYLKREAIVERLFYTQAISLFVGGKHHGKTTLARTCAMSVMRGTQFLGREVKQGHVIYAASDDEYPTTRMELLRMGWDGRWLTMVRIKPEAKVNPDKLLWDIATLAKRRGTIFIILDMLFDFAQIKDEMSYADTRLAVGKIQTLAEVTGAHVASTHHSPKYMVDGITAGQAALGSQGIAARFSPILLTRKWADGLYTTESTMTRDPRGLAIPQICVEIDGNGWAKSAGEFKSWMKWRVFAPKVMGLIEAAEPGTEWSVAGISQQAEISRPDAQNALYRLWKEGMLEREKRGKSYRYWLPLTKADLISQTDIEFEKRQYGGQSQD